MERRVHSETAEVQCLARTGRADGFLEVFCAMGFCLLSKLLQIDHGVVRAPANDKHIYVLASRTHELVLLVTIDVSGIDRSTSGNRGILPREHR